MDKVEIIICGNPQSGKTTIARVIYWLLRVAGFQVDFLGQVNERQIISDINNFSEIDRSRQKIEIKTYDSRKIKVV